MSNARLPSAALERRASPVMPLFLRGGALGSAACPRPWPRAPGGGTGSPSAVGIRSWRTQPLPAPRRGTQALPPPALVAARVERRRRSGNAGVRAARVAVLPQPLVEVVLRL